MLRNARAANIGDTYNQLVMAWNKLDGNLRVHIPEPTPVTTKAQFLEQLDSQYSIWRDMTAERDRKRSLTKPAKPANPRPTEAVRHQPANGPNQFRPRGGYQFRPNFRPFYPNYSPVANHAGASPYGPALYRHLSWQAPPYPQAGNPGPNLTRPINQGALALSNWRNQRPNTNNNNRKPWNRNNFQNDNSNNAAYMTETNPVSLNALQAFPYYPSY